MKSLLCVFALLLLMVTGWSLKLAWENRHLATMLQATHDTDDAHRRELSQLQHRLDDSAAALRDSIARTAQLESQNAEMQKRLEALTAWQTNDANINFDAAKKAAADRAWWASYHAAAARQLAERAAWQAQADQLAAQKAQQDEIARQNQAENELRAKAAETELLKARASARAADAAVYQALNPAPVYIIRPRYNPGTNN